MFLFSMCTLNTCGGGHLLSCVCVCVSDCFGVSSLVFGNLLKFVSAVKECCSRPVALVTDTTAAESALSWLETHGITMISASDAPSMVTSSALGESGTTLTLTGQYMSGSRDLSLRRLLFGVSLGHACMCDTRACLRVPACTSHFSLSTRAFHLGWLSTAIHDRASHFSCVHHSTSFGVHHHLVSTEVQQIRPILFLLGSPDAMDFEAVLNLPSVSRSLADARLPAIEGG